MPLSDQGGDNGEKFFTDIPDMKVDFAEIGIRIKKQRISEVHVLW